MRRIAPKWTPISLIRTANGLQELYVCHSCGTKCERKEKLHVEPENCVNEAKRERIKKIISSLEPAA